MEEILLACVPAVLAVALAMAMRLLRSRREASSEIAALQKKLAALRERNSELEVDLALARMRATSVSFREEYPVLYSPPVSPQPADPVVDVDRPELTANSWRFTQCEKEIDEALHRLQAIKALLPLDTTVEEKYVAELDAIVERIRQISGMNLSRWLGTPPQEVPPRAPSTGLQTRISSLAVHPRNRDLFRLKILSLQAFCNYQLHHPQPPRGFVPPPPAAARRIH